MFTDVHIPKHEISSVDDFHFLLSIGSSSGVIKSVERGKSRRTILFTSEGGQQCVVLQLLLFDINQILSKSITI
jgi:hypothetical protein